MTAQPPRRTGIHTPAVGSGGPTRTWAEQAEMLRVREQSLADFHSDQHFQSLFSFKGVSLAYLQKFWRQVRSSERYKDIELYTTLTDIPVPAGTSGETSVEMIPAGSTVGRADTSEGTQREEILLRCFYPQKGVFITVNARQVQWKDRKLWTIEEFCLFCIVNEIAVTKEPLIARLDDRQTGKEFDGNYIIYPKDILVEDLLVAMRKHVSKGITTADDSYFWVDFVCTNIAELDYRNLVVNTGQPSAIDKAYALERRELVKNVIKWKKLAINLFDYRMVFIDDWTKPKIFNNLWCFWEMFESCRDDKLSFKLLVEVVAAEQIMTVIDDDNDGLFGALDFADPSKMTDTGEIDKDELFTQLRRNFEGLATVKKMIKPQFLRFYVNEVKLFLEAFPASNSESAMKKLAVLKYKVGNYLRKHGEGSFGRQILNEALNIYKELQQFKKEIQERELSELTEGFQIELDIINGGASKVYLSLAKADLDDGDFDKAMTNVIYSEKETERVRAQKHMFFADVHEAKAEVLTKQGKFDAALKNYEAIELLFLGDFRGDKLRVAKVKYEEGNILKKFKSADKQNEALKFIQDAKKIQIEILGNENYGRSHIALSKTLSVEGSIYGKQQNYQAAVDCYRLAARVLKAVLGIWNPEIAKVFHAIGQSYGGMRDFPQALKYLEAALDTYKFCSGEASFPVGDVLNSEGLFLKEQAKYHEAEESFKNSVAALKRYGDNMKAQFIYTPDEEKRVNLLLASVHSNLGQTYELDSKDNLAMKCYSEAYLLTRDMYGEANPKTVTRKKRYERIRDKL